MKSYRANSSPLLSLRLGYKRHQKAQDSHRTDSISTPLLIHNIHSKLETLQDLVSTSCAEETALVRGAHVLSLEYANLLRLHRAPYGCEPDRRSQMRLYRRIQRFRQSMPQFGTSVRHCGMWVYRMLPL